MEYTTTRGRNSTRHVPVEEKQLVFFLPASGGVIHKQGSRVCTCASAVSRECLIACARYKRYMGTGFIEESSSSMFIEKVCDSVLWKSLLTSQDLKSLAGQLISWVPILRFVSRLRLRMFSYEPLGIGLNSRIAALSFGAGC